MAWARVGFSMMAEWSSARVSNGKMRESMKSPKAALAAQLPSGTCKMSSKSSPFSTFLTNFNESAVMFLICKRAIISGESCAAETGETITCPSCRRAVSSNENGANFTSTVDLR